MGKNTPVIGKFHRTGGICVARGARMEEPHSDLFVPIELVALDAVQNVRHRYAVRVTADLFGAFIVETEWGKIGTKGQSNRRAFKDQSDAARYVSSLLRRRDNAEKRIGRAYSPVKPVFS